MFYTTMKILKKQKQLLMLNILKALYPDTVTIPELQKVYEAILNNNFDRRNFRKKILNLDILDDTGKSEQFDGNRPAKLYKFKKKIEDKEAM